MNYQQRLLKTYYAVEELIRKNNLGKISIMGIPIDATDYLLKKMPEVYYYARDNKEKTKEILQEVKARIDFLLQEDDTDKNKPKSLHNRKDTKRENKLCQMPNKTA